MSENLSLDAIARELESQGERVRVLAARLREPALTPTAEHFARLAADVRLLAAELSSLADRPDIDPEAAAMLRRATVERLQREASGS